MKEIDSIENNTKEFIKDKKSKIPKLIDSLKKDEPPKEETEEVIKEEKVIVKEKEVTYTKREYTSNELKWKELFKILGAKNG